MKCSHKKCHPTNRLWVPCHVDHEGKEFDKIKPHYYCEECGEVEYLGPDKARRIGYFSNILGDIKRCLDVEYKKGGTLKITKTLLRLIVMELNRIDDFTDKFSKPFTTQKKEFFSIVKKFIPSLSDDRFEVFFDPNPPQYDEDSVNFYGKYYDELEDQYSEELAVQDGDEDYAFFS